ncbi:MAG: CHAT domain-containing protein, partial [Bacteroidota bacterium]
KIYIFLLTETQMEVFSVAYSSKLNEQIEQLRQAVSSLPSDQELANNFEQYTKTAFTLYEQLLAPALKQLPTSVSSLILIPDYQLNHLPFELLLMNPPLSTKPNFSVKNLDYVLEHYTLSYDYSAIMHIKNRQRNSGSYRQGFVGLAPIFIGSTEEAEPVNCRATALKPLACNQQEVQTIQNLIGGQSLLGKQAHKNTFDLLLPSSQIVHLATHACIDENSLTDDKIFLADDYISKHDLFNSRTNAELVVLSACNTGSGQLLKGEGVMSLARGFIQAGSASCVLSRWSVDDCATAKIMEQFYRSLKEEVGRSEALRLSKLSYLQSAEKYYQHPFFWGAFTTYGQTTPLKVWRSGLPPWLLPSLGALVILLLWSVWKFRFSRPTH